MIVAVRDISDRLENQRRLNAAHEQLALVGERERIGRDLHDVVLQHLYGMGLSAQAIATTADPVPPARLEAVVDEVDHIISEVRTIVFTLGPGGRRGALGQELADVVAQASRVLGFTPALRIEGPVETVLVRRGPHRDDGVDARGARQRRSPCRRHAGLGRGRDRRRPGGDDGRATTVSARPTTTAAKSAAATGSTT